MGETPNGSRSILVVAGETSGEAHAAGLMRELRKRLSPSKPEFFGSGGRSMADEGADLLLDVSRLAAIGPWAALAHAKDYLWLFYRIVREVRQRKPQLAILVDFPEFNLRLASRLRAARIPVCYFISPQVWAWRVGRVKQIRRFVDLMLVILPFEEEFFRSRGVDACYVGNPSASRMRPYLLAAGSVESRNAHRQTSAVALLPGSREKEIEQILPVQLDAALFLTEHLAVRFELVTAPAVPRSHIEGIYKRWLRRRGRELDLDIRTEGSQEILSEVDCAIVKSGTSTLEAMLLRVPFAMVYRLSYLSWLVLRPFVRTGTYCLANLVAGKQIVPEFVQKSATGQHIGAYMLTLLQDSEKRARVSCDLEQACERLGERDAYVEGARQIVTRFFSS